MDSGPAQVGFQNIGGKCWIISLVQAIYACKPLLRKILGVECPNPFIKQLKKVLQLLSTRKLSDAVISVLDVQTFYDIAHNITMNNGQPDGETSTLLVK